MIFLILSLQIFAAELFRFGPDNHMLFVEAQISDHPTPYLFRIDPSMRYSVLTDGVTETLKLPRSDFRGNEIATSTLRIEKTQLEGTFFIVQGSQDFPLWGGVIGADMLDQKVIDINLRTNSISFPETATSKPTHTFALSKDGIITQVQTKDDKKNHEFHIHFRSSPLSLKRTNGKKKGTLKIDKYTAFVNASTNENQKKQNEIGLNSMADARIILDMASSTLSVKKPFVLFPPKRKSYTSTLLKRFESKSVQGKSMDLRTVAKMYIQDAQIDKAIDTLKTIDKHDLVARSLLHKLQINTNTFNKDVITIESVKDFAQSENWVAIINQIWIDNQQERALELARYAVEIYPKEAGTWLALSDALTANEQFDQARSALGVAKSINKTPFAYTLRSALISYLAGDKEGSISYIRQRLQQPTANEAELYAYTRLFSAGPYQDIFKKDIQTKSFASDFLILALYALGDKKQTKEQQQSFQLRNCKQLKGDAQKNCNIWLNALAGTSTAKDAFTMAKITKKYPFRSDYWDTYAVVLYNQNNNMDAQYAIEKAFLYDPDNTYMMFQYHWFAQQ